LRPTPRQIHEEAAEDLAGIGAGRLLGAEQAPQVMEANAQIRIEIEVSIRAIALEEAGDVAYRRPVDHRAPHQRSHLLPGR
jgi:hypothetical protein